MARSASLAASDMRYNLICIYMVSLTKLYQKKRSYERFLRS